MKNILLLVAGAALLVACHPAVDKEAVKKEIFQMEKAFEKMAAEKSIAEAFAHFAADSAVIKRQRDTLITGKANIRAFYEHGNTNATVHWTPDFIDVADDGSMAYTFGKYVWQTKDEAGNIQEYKGVFHTVWKRQPDGSWRYVWD
jgi:ketosteroid isomerase-like protein